MSLFNKKGKNQRKVEQWRFSDSNQVIQGEIVSNRPYKNYGLPKDSVLKWQFHITGVKSDKVKLSKQQLIEATRMTVASHSRIVEDCVRLVNTTLTPGVFFDRYDTLIKEATELAKFEQFYPFNKSITEQINTLNANRAKNEIAFINKYYASVLDAANSLKTEKGRVNRLNKFFDIMKTYEKRMQPESLEHLNGLRFDR